MDRNPEIPFTYQYAQPEEYRFSLDSVEMAWEVAQHLRSRPMRRLRLVAAGESSDAGGEGDPLSKSLSRMQVLDLCAGCGIVGFDFQYHMPEIEKIDFVEIQNTYKSYFEKNLEMVLLRRPQLVDKNFNFLEMNYEDLMKDEKFHHHYDLILCNPPYFFPEQGKMSPSEFKNRCRFYLDSTFAKLIESIDYCLAMEGEAYVLVRPLDDHGIDIFSELRTLLQGPVIQGRLHCENLTMVRGTFLLKFYR
jgi:tRNA1Val (adenine37-N6)-methyltransferase